jgi:hypothetical protein
MTTTPARRTRWPFARIVILILAAAFFGLMADIRVEHIDIVRITWKGWIPIAFAAFMTLACLVAFFCWYKIVRRIMLVLFLAAFVVGGLGFYFHNGRGLARVPQDALHAWTNPDMRRVKGPPETAPLAFAGLGLLGLLASLDHFN